MSDDAQDRRLPASERKIGKARGEGQVARSRDLGHLGALGIGGAVLFLASPALLEWVKQMLVQGLSFEPGAVARPEAMTEQLGEMSWRMLVVVLPIGFVMAAVALAAGVFSGGWNFTLKALEPKFSKLNPISGLGRMVQPTQMLDLAKSSLLALVLGAIGAVYLNYHLEDFQALLAQPLPGALVGAGELVVGGMALQLLALVAFALVDVPFQRYKLLKQLRMSHEEVKKENKDIEGNQEVKGKIRARMRSLANRRMLAAVPAADIIVMNPTHFAVALKYEEGTMGAPRVIAKGADQMAMRIRDAAKAASVPILQAPPLARALYAHCELDQEVPAALFAVVAQVLAWVYQLRQAMAQGRPLPADLPPLSVPPELDPANKRRPGRGAGAGAEA